MATQYKYIKSDNTEGMVSASSAEEAMKTATDRLATSGVQAIQQAPTAPVIPIDSVMTPTPTIPKINTTPVPPSTEGSVSNALATASMPPVEPVKEDTTARGTMEKLAGKLFGGGQDVVAEREQLRIDAQTREKEAQSRLMGNKLTARQEKLRRDIEAIQTTAGLTKAQADAKVSEISRVANRELADLSFSYNVALGDYQAAEKIVSERLSDIQAQRTQDIQAFNTLFNFVQNDMTESEKLQAQQAWQEKQNEKDFAQRKELMAYENTLKQADPLYQAQLLKAQAELAEKLGNTDEQSFKETVANQGRVAVSNMLGIAEKNPGIFGKTAAIPLPDMVRSDAFRNYEAQLDFLKGNIIPAALTAMREASKTGGALGQVSDREGAWLAASLGALSMKQSPDQVVNQLKQIDASLARWQSAVNQYGGQTTDTNAYTVNGQTYKQGADGLYYAQ